MKLPGNSFKHRLSEAAPQFGLWAALADGYVTELLATAGFDWIVIDNEHAPNDVRSSLSQLQVLGGYPCQPIVRPVKNDVAVIKQYLDIGAQTLIIPMIDTEADAELAVAATRYPPGGVRGVGSALGRASRWNKVDGYFENASKELCLIVQVESTIGMDNLEAIANVDGVDGVFFGPADLSASMGFEGDPSHPVVRQAVCAGIKQVRAIGKSAGVLATYRAYADEYLAAGANLIAIATDTGLLSRAASDVVSSFKAPSVTASERSQAGY
ncbi:MULTISPECIES: HpcH/HpaI aldolase/citrate lyase family protein [Paraburkholderia]|uniref:HpcH/HpaI aldolase/citrate lyase family protein n=1 Tax=Paraburkholderia TaxID=1822464 RepID=UPI002252CD0A|nr:MULTISPECIES: HpcH/HpaI aldolase/citrate lyase family protein [Paraburkholderia]MCX4176985.1 HpcH/HpaI aldolase/citrate lyase family protein [Paraburkholderia madseniana]MDQ6464975.1 HpcH/HpaI aldolase/citrate lyase family protein [Paraburkholderia madseniana]